ncbi:MAG: hypothetical protein Q9186_005144 [Xanthomendoza sp. 1 TL-2023]
MADSQTPRMGLDDAANIKAFLLKISQAGNPAASSSKTAELTNKVGELDINHEKTTAATKAEANGPMASAFHHRAASTFLSSSESGVLTANQTETMSAPADHFKSKNPVLAAVQAQNSPQLSGLRAPPPTPETVPNVAIGQLFMNALDDIPQHRILSLGDSMHAPKNLSRMHNSRSTAATPSNPHFFSPVPQSSRPRDDPSFTRMSFKAAETPSAPIFHLPNAGTKPPDNFQLTVQGPPSATNLKGNARVGKSIDASSQTDASDGSRSSNIYTYVTADTSRTAAPITTTKIDTPYTPNTPDKPLAAATVKGTTISTLDTPKTPPPAPRLKPAPAEVVTASRVITPEIPNRPLDVSGKGVVDEGTSLQPRYSRVNPFATDSVRHPIKQDRKENQPPFPVTAPNPKKQEKQEHRPLPPAVVPKLSEDVTSSCLDFDAPDGPQTPGGVPLTPASMNFGAVSPQSAKAAGIETASMPGKIAGEDLEGLLYFKAWPKNEERATRTAAKVRKILLTGIPTGASPTLVASFVFGGPLEQIQVNERSAYVTFLRDEDAAKYYEATGNGLLYKKDDVEHVIMTEMTQEVNPVSGILREYIEKEFTRCVRAIGVEEDWTMRALHETAARKGRRVEKIVDGLNASKVSATRVDHFLRTFQKLTIGLTLYM